MRVAIGIVTYQRPQGLRRLLDSLAKLMFVKSPQPQLRILVVDNDTNGSARAVVDAVRPQLSCYIEYIVEPRRGIPMARNRTVKLAQDDDFLAFIDDDEVASPGWLDELLAVQCQSGAGVVAGPVLPHFEIPPPNWIRAGNFYNATPPMQAGVPLFTGCGNVLIARRCFLRQEQPFAECFALTGGEDTDWSLRLRHQGETIMWAEQAYVEEYVPASRMTVSWLVQRAYRCGNSFTLCMRRRQRMKLWWLSRSIKGIGRIGQGIVLLLPALLMGRVAFIRALMAFGRGCGTLAAILGHQYEEYRQIHGH